MFEFCESKDGAKGEPEVSSLMTLVDKDTHAPHARSRRINALLLTRERGIAERLWPCGSINTETSSLPAAYCRCNISFGHGSDDEDDDVTHGDDDDDDCEFDSD